MTIGQFNVWGANRRLCGMLYITGIPKGIDARELLSRVSEIGENFDHTLTRLFPDEPLSIEYKQTLDYHPDYRYFPKAIVLPFDYCTAKPFVPQSPEQRMYGPRGFVSPRAASKVDLVEIEINAAYYGDDEFSAEMKKQNEFSMTYHHTGTQDELVNKLIDECEVFWPKMHIFMSRCSISGVADSNLLCEKMRKEWYKRHTAYHLYN